MEFSIEDYIERKLNSSAAHVYSNDLFQAAINGIFNKTDKKHNHITSVLSSNFKSYLNGEIKQNSLFELFEKFNDSFRFGEWIDAKEVISEMKKANWYQWRGTEWPGRFLEYEFAKFILSEHCESQMSYIGNVKTSNMLDLDLIFPKEHYYGDLKASDIGHSKTPEMIRKQF